MKNLHLDCLFSIFLFIFTSNYSKLHFKRTFLYGLFIKVRESIFLWDIEIGQSLSEMIREQFTRIPSPMIDKYLKHLHPHLILILIRHAVTWFRFKQR